jgi:hypothetical protein
LYYLLSLVHILLLVRATCANVPRLLKFWTACQLIIIYTIPCTVCVARV